MASLQKEYPDPFPWLLFLYAAFIVLQWSLLCGLLPREGKKLREVRLWVLFAAIASALARYMEGPHWSALSSHLHLLTLIRTHLPIL